MEENRKVIVIAIIVVAVIVVALGIYFLFFHGKGKEAPAVQEVTEKPIQAAEEAGAGVRAPEPIKVALDESDSPVRDLAKGLSSNPDFALWLMSKDLIRKFTAAVDNIAQGQSPRAQVDFFSPKGKFRVIKKKGLIYLDAEDYIRYNPVADAFASLDTKSCVRLYRQLRIPIQEAYAELGYPDQDFNETLTEAIVELLKVPAVQGDIRLEEKVVSYALADPKLENLSEAQKHLLRMGPENVQKIQDKLREFASELGIPAARLPHAR